MGLFDTIAGFFGNPREKKSYAHIVQQPPREDFKKPDWANDGEDSDDDLVHRYPPNAFSFNVFANPIEIHRYFEQQVNEMSKQFEQMFSNDSFFNDDEMGMKRMMDGLFSGIPSYREYQNPAILPPPGQNENQSLRDKCFKPNSKTQFIDSDLDKEFKSGQVDLFKPSEIDLFAQPRFPQVPRENFSSQVFTKIVRRPDGTTEEIRTKKVGDKSYTRVVKTDVDGKQHIHEDIVNIDEEKIKDFRQNFDEVQIPKLDFKDWFRFRL